MITDRKRTRRGTENRKRTHQIGVRLLPEEFDALTTKATNEGVSPGELLRRALAAITPPISPASVSSPLSDEHADLHRALHQERLARIAACDHEHSLSGLAAGGKVFATCSKCGGRFTVWIEDGS